MVAAKRPARACLAASHQQARRDGRQLPLSSIKHCWETCLMDRSSHVIDFPLLDHRDASMVSSPLSMAFHEAPVTGLLDRAHPPILCNSRALWMLARKAGRETVLGRCQRPISLPRPTWPLGSRKGPRTALPHGWERSNTKLGAIPQSMRETMRRLVIMVTGMLFFAGCVTPMQVSHNQTFALSRDTPVTVAVQNDYAGVQGRVEAKLLQLGLNVVPVDVARKAIEARQDIVTGERTVTSRAALEASVYYPTALVISIAYQTHSDMIMQGFTFFNARFLDLSSQRVLGVASFSQGANWVTMNYTLDSFARELAGYIK